MYYFSFKESVTRWILFWRSEHFNQYFLCMCWWFSRIFISFSLLYTSIYFFFGSLQLLTNLWKSLLKPSSELPSLLLVDFLECRPQSNELTRGDHWVRSSFSLIGLGGVHIGVRALLDIHKFDMAWLYRLPIRVGRRGVFYYLPSLPLEEEGGGQHPVVPNSHWLQGKCVRTKLSQAVSNAISKDHRRLPVSSVQNHRFMVFEADYWKDSQN